MTLTKKLALGVLVMLLLVFLGTYLITMNNARNFFMQQIESNAQDTATSLGLSLSQSFAKDDVATMNSMVQAVFDRGYFSTIEVKDMQGNVLVVKQRASSHSRIPLWFEHLIKWSSSEKSSLVMNGWMQAGMVSVVGDPSYLYYSLWGNAVEMVKGYILFAVVALALAYGFIQHLLKPLKRITAQALAISEHEFPIEEHIPKTPELRQVTLAMNKMVAKVKSFFDEHVQQTESLRIQVYQDSLTSLSNRRHFIQQLSTLIDNEDEFVPGMVLMLVIDGLDELNQKQGFQQGDNLVLAAASVFKEFWSQPSTSALSRISGSTFALISHETDPVIFNSQCREFEHNLKQAIMTMSCKYHMGVANYARHQPITELLTLVDESVKSAREKRLFYSPRELNMLDYPQVVTLTDIKETLKQKKLTLHTQCVTDGVRYLHKELFVRMCDNNNNELGAGYFMPIAEKLGIAHRIDKYVLAEVITKKVLEAGCFAVNISADTLMNDKYSLAYLQQLKKLPRPLLANLSLEISELYVMNYFPQIKTFVKEAKALGVSVGVDRAGVQFTPFQYLSDLHIDYIKLHGSLVQDIDENESKQYFLHYFNEMAKTVDIQVVATQIEQEAQWQSIQIAHVMWGQGQYLAAVEPLA